MPNPLYFQWVRGLSGNLEPQTTTRPSTGRRADGSKDRVAFQVAVSDPRMTLDELVEMYPAEGIHK